MLLLSPRRGLPTTAFRFRRPTPMTPCPCISSPRSLAWTIRRTWPDLPRRSVASALRFFDSARPARFAPWQLIHWAVLVRTASPPPLAAGCCGPPHEQAAAGVMEQPARASAGTGGLLTRRTMGAGGGRRIQNDLAASLIA